MIIKDRSSFVDRLAALQPFTINNKMLLFKTPYGSVLTMLYSVPTPGNEKKPFVFYEKYINIYNQDELKPYLKLTDQAYLHVFILNEACEIIETFEFENFFNVNNDLLPWLEQVIAKNPLTDIHAAIQYVQQRYTLDDLYILEG